MDAPPPFPYRIGRVARPHGLRGELMVQLFRRRDLALDEARHHWRRLKHPQLVELEDELERLERLTLTHIRWLDPIRVVLRFAEIGDRTEAEARIGSYLDLDPEGLRPELNDEVDRCFLAEVRHAETDAVLGQVVAIRDNGAQALLEVETPDEGERVLVPFVPAFVVEVHALPGEPRRVRLSPIPGLFPELGG